MFLLHAADELVGKYYASGSWREDTVAEDIERWAASQPEKAAVIAHRADGEVFALTYGELDRRVGQFAGALASLGVKRGDVVAMQLPNWWQAPVLMVACWRLGAVIAPIITTLRAREVERVLRRLGARVLITVDRWDGYDHAAMAREIAPDLPDLRYRVVFGDDVKAGELAFGEHFQRADPLDSFPAVSPDQVSAVWLTSGTSGEPKAALHTVNTTLAEARCALGHLVQPDSSVFSANSVMHGAGGGLFCLVVSRGATLVMADRWDPTTVAELLEEASVTGLLLAPYLLTQLLGALRGRRRGSVRAVAAIAERVTPTLVAETEAVLGLPLRSVWAMTEAGALHTDPADPPGWAAHSVGRPALDTEIQLRPVVPGAQVTEANPGRMFIRGPGVCLATMGRDSGTLTVLAERDDGWYDTGDLAVGDGRQGYRLVGRASDRIGGSFMIPVADVEDALRACPDVIEVAVVGHHEGAEGCAVVVAKRRMELPDVHDFLRSLGMTEWYWPTRVENISVMPKNAMGKIEKARLRAWLAAPPGTSASPDNPA